MPRPSHLIVWDLDNTLGVFEALEDHQDLDEPVTVLLRPGIEAALESLAAAGFGHTVLTLASPRYAELVLRATGLRHYFLEVAGGGQRFKGDDEGIARAFGIPLDRRPDQMIFVGDHPWNDAPHDHRIVFHLEPTALKRRAQATAELILLLRELGAGSLRAGFDALARASCSPTRIAKVEDQALGTIVLFARDQECPVIGFDRPLAPEATAPQRVTFVPAEVEQEDS